MGLGRTAETRRLGRKHRVRRGDRRRGWPLGLFLAVVAGSGCNRTFYREATDHEARVLVEQKSNDPRWALDGFSIEVDPRSRIANVHDPDFPPMPVDDPASHEFMVRVDGKKAYSGWNDYGETFLLDNPYWRECLGQYARITEDGKLYLRMDDAVRVARINSPDYQEQLETIYLSALDVSTERFRFDTQFFGGANLGYQHIGERRAGGERNTLTLTTDAQVTRSFAAAGELLVGFANNTVWEFTGPNRGFTTSLLNFSLVQPLLRAGGRAVALERLTISERTLLANLRSMQRYRQGFYGTVVIGDTDVGGPQRRGGFFGAGLTGFTGQGSGGFAGVGTAAGFGRGFGGTGTGGGTGAFAGGGVGNVGGFVGLLQSLQQIRNAEESLNLQLRTLALLEANLDAGLVNLAQVDQFRQSIETQRAVLLQSRNGLQSSLDTFKRGTLGLPPDLPIELDDGFLRQFRLIDGATSAVQTDLDSIITELGELPTEPSVVELQGILNRMATVRAALGVRLDTTPLEFQLMDAKTPLRFATMSATEQAEYHAVRQRLAESYQRLVDRYEASGGQLEALNEQLSPEGRGKTAEAIISLITELQAIANDVSLVHARSRIEAITVEPIDLTSEVALEIARANRLDWMNNRAALVDTWRLIEFNANALKSDLTVRMSGDVQTVRNNPLSFDENAGTLRASVQFDPPFTRLVERNVFRQQLIEYQQSRRRMIQFEDGVNQTMRALLRDLEQLRVNLEIQRRAVAIAIRRVDQTRESLNRPVPPTLPGQPPAALGPTVAQDLLFALSDLRSAQDALMSVWLGYYASRMRLYRELGVMQLDDDGLWIDTPFMASDRATRDAEPLPPSVPPAWFADAPYLPLPDEGARPDAADPEPAGGAPEPQPVGRAQLSPAPSRGTEGVEGSAAGDAPARLNLSPRTPETSNKVIVVGGEDQAAGRARLAPTEFGGSLYRRRTDRAGSATP